MRRALISTLVLTVSAVLACLPGTASAAPSRSGETQAATLTSTYQLLNAPVPSVCGHPAGTLVQGKLPGIPTGQGVVKLRFGTARLIPVASGGTGAVAAIECNQGGVPWANHVVVWDRNKKVIGHFDLKRMSTYSRAYITRFAMSKGTIYGYMTGIGAADEAACCYTRTARVALGWSSASRRYIVRSRHIYYETTYARLLVDAVNKGDRTRALRYGTATAVKQLWNFRGVGGGMKLMRCGDTYSSPRYGGRMCTVTAKTPMYWFYDVEMVHPTSTTMSWKARYAEWNSTD